jgi:hypothetical protein
VPRGRNYRKRSQQWYLTKYINYFDLDALEVECILGKEQMQMFEAVSSRKISEYSYVISHHNFLPEDMDSGYWKGLLRNKNIRNIEFEGVKLPVCFFSALAIRRVVMPLF